MYHINKLTEVQSTLIGQALGDTRLIDIQMLAVVHVDMRFLLRCQKVIPFTIPHQYNIICQTYKIPS